jgi:hypothetical protein
MTTNILTSAAHKTEPLGQQPIIDQPFTVFSTDFHFSPVIAANMFHFLVI